MRNEGCKLKKVNWRCKRFGMGRRRCRLGRGLPCRRGRLGRRGRSLNLGRRCRLGRRRGLGRASLVRGLGRSRRAWGGGVLFIKIFSVKSRVYFSKQANSTAPSPTLILLHTQLPSIISQLPKRTPIPKLQTRHIPTIFRQHAPLLLINIFIIPNRLLPMPIKMSASPKAWNWRGLPFSGVSADVSFHVSFGWDFFGFFHLVVFL